MNITEKSKFLYLGERIFILAVLATLTFLICTNLSSYIFFPKTPQLDSSVFRYIGTVMQDGGVPYRDSFDHKGPLIFLINYLGLFFGKNGVWYFEYALLLVTAAEVYAVLRVFCGKPLSLAGTSMILLQLYDYLGEGNYTEEYALPFIVGALLVFTKYFIVEKASPVSVALCGVCCMAVLLLRANMVATWIVFPIAVLFKEIRGKTNRWGVLIIYFLFGAIMFLLPFLVYFGMNNALDDLWEQYIIFNFSYSSTSTTGRLLADRYFLLEAPCVMATLLSSLCVVCLKKDKEIDRVSLAYIFVSLVLIGMSGRTYNHYGIILIPLTIIPIARTLGVLAREVRKKELTLSLVVTMLILGWPWVYSLVNKTSLVTPSEQTLEGIISKHIRDNTEEDDFIIQCGHKDVFYILSDRRAASKYSYPLPIAMFDEDVYDIFFEQLAENRPVVVIADKWTEHDQLDYTEMNKRLETFVEEFHYVKGPTVEDYTLYYVEGSSLANQLHE